jgi:predicted outer membrane repeat protein
MYYLVKISANSNGGAIIKNGKLTTNGKNALFSSNFANSLGGAISTIRELTFQDGAKFTNNVAVSSGGAIYNTDTLNLIADTNNIEFTGNTANGISNAIHDGGGTINLWAGKGSIIFNDRITSENTTSVININQSSGTLPTTGTVILNEDMEGFLGNVNFKSGKIQLGNNGTLFNNFTVSNGATFDFADSVIKNYSFKNLTVSNGLANITIDADLANESMDTISADNYSGTGKMDVNKINIITDSTKINTDDVIFTTSTILKDNITATTTAIGPLYNYNVVYSTNTGVLIYKRGSKSNSIRRSRVSNGRWMCNASKCIRAGI